MATDSIDLALMRAAARLDSDPPAAARAAAEIIARAPRNTEAQLLLASAWRRMGDAKAAAGVLEGLSALNPDSTVLQLELARAYRSGGRFGEARGALERALALDEALGDAWRELAELHFAQGEESAGDRAYARYCALAATPPEHGDALMALADNRLEAAAEILQHRLQQVPEDVGALRLLAEAASRWGDEVQAERRLRECLERAPGYGAARRDLVRLLHGQQRSTEVLPLIERLLAQEPDNVEDLATKAQTLRLIGRIEDGIALLQATLERRPREDALWLLYGHLLREVGRPSEAIQSYRHVLALRPGSGRAWWALANLKTFRFTDAERAAIATQLPGAHGPEAVHLEFALGKALEDVAAYDESFEHYRRGNALQLATLIVHPEAAAGELERSRQLYTAEFFRARVGFGSAARDPIFIIGLPRSGSTLLEQILASHSQIEGTRELSTVVNIVRELIAHPLPGTRAGYPQLVEDLTEAQVRTLAASYLEHTRPARTQGRPRFVDKMLGNFAHLGLIQLMFPRATIIDARRHPLACGFSCYKQLFTRPLAFTYGLEEFARYYRQYDAHVRQFESVLPGRIYRVYYEQLIADPEREVRALLAHCGLEFEPQCLRFYENPRAVLTVSSEQVRQPLYTESLEHWRHYERHLEPLRVALGPLVTDYPGTKPRT